VKNKILENTFFYRFYQKIIRKKRNEFDFIKYIFSQNKNTKVLDICCGDSFVLNYISNDIENYIGIDNNIDYLQNLKNKYPNYEFIFSNIENINKISLLKNTKIDFIFFNGAIHHLNDQIVLNLLNFLEENFPDAKYLSIDPLKDNNKFLNRLMIYFDRGQHIRNILGYKKIMKSFNFLITDNFFVMSFKLIFHYKNFDLNKIYINWKNS